MATLDRRRWLAGAVLGFVAAALLGCDEGSQPTRPTIRWQPGSPLCVEPGGRLLGTLSFEVPERSVPITLRVDQGYVEDGRAVFGGAFRYRLPDLTTDLAGHTLGVQARWQRGTTERTIHPRALPLERGWLELEIPPGDAGLLELVLGNEEFPTAGPFAPTVPVDLQLHFFAGETRFGAAEVHVRQTQTDWLRVLGPTDVVAGESLELVVTFQHGASSPRSSSAVADDPSISGLELRWNEGWKRVETTPLRGDDPHRGRRLVVPDSVPSGVHRLRVRVAGHEEIWGVSSPMVVHERAPPERRWFGSLHNHSTYGGHAASTPRRLLRFGRELSRLDFCGVTEHSEAPGFDWDALVEVVDDLDEPGRFVTFAGFEWTHAAAGHRHVVFRDPASAEPVRIATPERAATSMADVAGDLKSFADSVGRDPNALVFVHHPLWFGGAAQGRYQYGAPGEVPRQLLAEVYSWHGCSLGGPDDPFPIHDYAGHQTVRRDQGILTALNRGHRFALVADSDNHLGMPGSLVGVEWARARRYATAGVMAVNAPRLTRDAIFEALEDGRVYGTTGARMLLEVQPTGARRASLRVHATAPLARLRVLAGEGIVHEEHFEAPLPTETLAGVPRYGNVEEGVWDLERALVLPVDPPWVLEIRQHDEHTAWTVVLPAE